MSRPENAVKPLVPSLWQGCPLDDSEDGQGFPGEEGVREAVRGGGTGEGARPRGWGDTEVLEGKEGAGGGGAKKEDVGGRNRDSGKGSKIFFLSRNNY